MAQFRKTYEKTVTLGHRLDLVFHQIRLGFFFMDYDLISRNLEKTKRYGLFFLRLKNVVYSSSIVILFYVSS